MRYSDLGTVACFFLFCICTGTSIANTISGTVYLLNQLKNNVKLQRIFDVCSAAISEINHCSVFSLFCLILICLYSVEYFKEQEEMASSCSGEV